MTEFREKTSAVDCLCVGLLVADFACEPIDHSPRAGELVQTPRLSLSLGGCAANTAANLARLGISAGVIGCVGHDPLGSFVVDQLRAAGVDTSGIRSLADRDTSSTMIVNVRGDDRRFIHAAGANLELTPGDVPPARIRAARVLYVGGYLLMPRLEGRPLADLFRQARAAGVKTVLDCILPGPGDYGPPLADVLRETDVFLPNRDEAAAITGLDDPLRQAERLAEAGPGAVVVTCGSEGCVLVAGHQRLRAAAYPVACQSPTGAGDAFDAGYIYGLLAGLEPVDCLRWGSALGASAVRSTNATQSVFTRGEAQSFIADHPLRMDRF